jgi:hypothetical protein
MKARAPNLFAFTRYDVGLVSPMLDLSGLGQCTLSFDLRIKNNWIDASTLEASVFSDYALDRTIFNAYTADQNSAGGYDWRHYSVAFDPSALVDPANAQIEFRAKDPYAVNYDNYGGPAYIEWGIDNVLIECSESGYLEISNDGGENWYVLDHYTGCPVGPIAESYDISTWAGDDLLIRFRAVGEQDESMAQGGSWCIDDVMIYGKIDNTPPVSTATMTGTMKESGWYTTPVKITITATDDYAMGEIHYKLDGVETVVQGNTATVTVSGNGDHTFEYWACDAMGNCETTHHFLPPFHIDAGAKPTVSITAPTPGIYFMGKKLLSSSNIIIIGSFTAEATAADADSGIYRVTFYLDGNVVADDTTAPYSAFICSKHTGAATLKVVAEDFAQNTAEAEITLKYFKFF